MSVRGGWGLRGTWAAERRLRAVTLSLLVSSSALLALAPAGDAQSISDPWWGPSDRANPTGGWAVRVPIVVENDKDHEVTDAIVVAEVDFGKLLVKAGWTNRTTGAETTLRGFTLDVDSIRVVPYGTGFSSGPIDGSATKPVPHHFYQALLEGTRTRDFDAQRNPAGTLVFHVPGTLAPQEKRFYYVYANPLEYESAPMRPYPHTMEERAVVDSFLWGSSGQTFYGYEPQQSGRLHYLEFVALTTKPTKVEVYQNTLGKFNLVPPTETSPNPLTLGHTSTGFQAGQFYVPAGTAYKVVADHPIMMMAHGPTSGATDPNAPAVTSEWRGFVPSLDGSYAGDTFLVFGGAPQSGGPAASPTVTLTLIKATPGTATVQQGGFQYQLTAASPFQYVAVRKDQWSLVQATGTAKILVLMGDGKTAGVPFQGFQVPALSGGPTGTDFIAPVAQDGGYATLCSRENATLRIVDLVRPTNQLDPEGPTQSTDPYKLAGSANCRVSRATTSWPRDSPIEVYTVKPDDATPARPIALQVGAENRPRGETTRQFVGYYGGEAATSFFTRGKVGLFGHYNDTRVTMFVEKEKNGVKTVTNQTFAISRDGFLSFDPARQFEDATGRLSFVTSKPLVVVSMEEAPPAYTTFVPGRPNPPRVTLGNAEFRGPLVELRSREKDGRQDFRSTGPGTPVTFPLEVQNLGRWVAGDGLADTVTLTCTTLEGWKVDGCGKPVTLASGTAERVDITVTPPEDALNVNGTFVVEARSKYGNVASSMKLIVFVEIRYGVGMWFDVEGGRKTIDPAIGVDPGETYRYNVLVKNTGSATDRFELTVEDARPGWTQALLDHGEPVTELTLEGGETRVLTFAVTAPEAESAQQNIVSIRAQSVSSALAGDVVNTATRIRPKVSINMELDPQTRVAEPNETATFNVTVTNTGNDIFLVALKREGLLPQGWNASFNLEPPEVNLNPNPTRDPNLSYTFKLRVTPPLGARAGDLATLKLTAETDTGGGVVIPGDEASAVVVVRKVHNVTTPPLLDAQAAPGERLDYVLPVANHGNGNDVLELLPGAVTPAWRVAPGTESLYLDYNESADLPLAIDVPERTPPGLYNLTFTLRLSREAFQNLTIPIVVRPTPLVAVRGPASLDVTPGRAREAQMTAVNVGNVPGEFALSADAPAGWNATFRPARVTLAPGETAPVTLVVNATRDAQDGAFSLGMRAALAGEPAGATPLAVNLARPDLHLEDVDATGSTRPGDLVVVTASVRNTGGTAAENVTVALLVEGKAVDAVVLSRIPIGETKVATLSWTSTKRTTDLSVVVDPGSEIVQKTDAQDDAAAVTFANKLTPFPAWGVLVAAALLALGTRRKPSTAKAREGSQGASRSFAADERPSRSEGGERR